MISTSHLHPMIVHFPIALLIAGFVAEIVSLFFRTEKCLSRAGFYLLVLGSLAAIAAWSSGHLFTSEPAEGAVREIFLRHETGGLITMLLAIGAIAFRTWLIIAKKEGTQLKWIALALYFAAFASVCYTGFIGGTMVYSYMMAL